MGRMRRAEMKLMSMIPGRIAIAVSASRQFSRNRMTTATINRISDTAGDTIASCSIPVVVSTSPLMRLRMPPVFMSHSRGSGRCSNRSKSARRRDSITTVLSSRCR